MANGHGGKRVRAGRPKGRVADETADIKAMVIGALQAVGGAEYFAARALDQPVAFMALVGRIIPLQLTGENGGALAIDIRWGSATPEQSDPVTIDAEAEQPFTIEYDTETTGSADD